MERALQNGCSRNERNEFCFSKFEVLRPAIDGLRDCEMLKKLVRSVRLITVFLPSLHTLQHRDAGCCYVSYVIEYDHLLVVDKIANPVPNMPVQLLSVMADSMNRCGLVANGTCTPSSTKLSANARVSFRVGAALSHPRRSDLYQAVHRDLSSAFGVNFRMLYNTTVDEVSAAEGWSMVSTTFVAPAPLVVQAIIDEGNATLSTRIMPRVDALLGRNGTRLLDMQTIWVRACTKHQC